LISVNYLYLLYPFQKSANGLDANSALNAAHNIVDYLSKIHRIVNAAVQFVARTTGGSSIIKLMILLFHSIMPAYITTHFLDDYLSDLFLSLHFIVKQLIGPN
jgi:hypothetical protein